MQVYPNASLNFFKEFFFTFRSEDEEYNTPLNNLQHSIKVEEVSKLNKSKY